MTLVLVVDDEDHIRFLIRKVLESAGYGVVEARDGLDALHVMENHDSIDLIALDIRMPNMDGLEFLSELRKKTRRPPVIVLTAHLNQVPDTLQRHINAHIIKPFSRHKLLDTVNNVLNASTH